MIAAFLMYIMPNRSISMANIILSKESSNNELKCYFEAVLKLSQSDNEFPINLEDVWVLAYTNKGDAVKALKRNFIESIDYKVFSQNPKNPKGGRPTENYLLSTSCLEYFIARKVRPVFEVYRQVFHKTMQKSQMQDALVKYDRMLNESLKQTAEGLKQIENLNEQLWEEKARVQIMLEERTKDIEVKNSLMAFLVEMKLHGKWQKYKADRQLKETVKRLKTEQKKKESRPYELPF